MTIQLAKDYFSKLLNTSVDENTVINLSSGQSARAYAWLRSNNFNADNLSIGNGFTLQHLFKDGDIKLDVKNDRLPKSTYAAPEQVDDYFTTSIGIDIQSISELFPQGLPIDPKTDNELLEIFTIKELSYAQSKAYPEQTLTGIFAAKEAVIKCTLDKLSFNDIELLPDNNGIPYTSGYSVSISHSKDYAVALAFKKNDRFVNRSTANHIPHNTATVKDENFEIKSINPIRKSLFTCLIFIFLMCVIISYFALIRN